jgi:hypothetical protein
LVFSGLKVTSFSGKTKGRKEKARPNGFIRADYERRAASQEWEAGSWKLEVGSWKLEGRSQGQRATNRVKPFNRPRCGRVNPENFRARQSG